MATINDRVPEVLLMLGNRTDLTARIIAWLGKAYLDVGFGYDFDELEDDIDVVLAGGGDGTLPYPDNARAVEGVTAYTTSGSPIPLTPKDMKTVRGYPNTSSNTTPGIFATHGTQIFFRPIPLNDTPVTIDFWSKPVLSDPVENTPLLLPDDWLEILDYMAAMRGHVALIERDKAQEIQNLLFGYTIPTTNRMVPGLIKEKLTRRQAQARNSDFGIAPRMR